MLTFLRRRPSPAMLVALLALVVALNGPAYATHAFRSIAHSAKKRDARKVLKSHTVTKGLLARNLPATILKADSVTGTQVLESSLGKVPAAAQADHAAAADAATHANDASHADAATRADTAGRADSAASADALTGRSIRAVQTPMNGSATIFENQSVRLFADCAGGSSVQIKLHNKTAGVIYSAALRDQSTGSLDSGAPHLPQPVNAGDDHLLYSTTTGFLLGQGFTYSAVDRAGNVLALFDIGVLFAGDQDVGDGCLVLIHTEVS